MRFIILSILLTACGAEPVANQAAVGTGDTKPAQGEPGQDGAKGATGATGPQGAKGDKGDKGIAGIDGANGTDGTDGKDGKNGAKGLAGSTGAAGTNGTDGLDGTDGIDGAHGATGSQGAVGATGAQGTAGVQGATGAQGIAGTAGGHDINVLDGSNALIGQLWYVTSDEHLWVANGSMRFEIASPAGTFPNAYLVFSGASCTGTARLVLLNGLFANVFVDARDGSLIGATGHNLGAFTYQSRVPQGNSCQNTSGSVTLSYATSVPALGFTYPIANPQMDN